MKNFIVIGGSSGIGKEIVNLLESENYNMIATYNSNRIENRKNINYI